jgi:hypothetical protein
MIRVICICGRAFKAEDRHAGRQTKCPECGADLTIGPAPVPSGRSAEEVPAWWYPGGATDQAARGTVPTRSGSDTGSHAVSPTVASSGSVQQPGPQASGPSPPAASFPARKHWAIIGGSAALVFLAMGALLWLRPGAPGEGGVAPAPRGAELDKPDESGRNRPAPPSASAGAKDSSEKRLARSSAGAAGTDAAASRTKGDAGGLPKPSFAGTARGLRLLVPAYIYPAGEGKKEWHRLIDAASKVEIVVIANPNSGPGEDRDIEYDVIFTEASARGVTLVGYVSTDFGKRSQLDIKKDIDTWFKFYPQIRGIFFDQQPRESHHTAHFAELRDAVRQKLKDPLVITNPGIPCDESYLAQGVSNVTCVFVNFQGFDRFELPATFKPYDASRFAAMPYNISDAETMRTLVKEVVLKRIGYLYISDAKPPNAWGKLPAYWEAEVDAVSRFR